TATAKMMTVNRMIDRKTFEGRRDGRPEPFSVVILRRTCILGSIERYLSGNAASFARETFQSHSATSPAASVDSSVPRYQSYFTVSPKTALQVVKKEDEKTSSSPHDLRYFECRKISQVSSRKKYSFSK